MICTRLKGRLTPRFLAVTLVAMLPPLLAGYFVFVLVEQGHLAEETQLRQDCLLRQQQQQQVALKAEADRDAARIGELVAGVAPAAFRTDDTRLLLALVETLRRDDMVADIAVEHPPGHMMVPARDGVTGSVQEFPITTAGRQAGAVRVMLRDTPFLELSARLQRELAEAGAQIRSHGEEKGARLAFVGLLALLGTMACVAGAVTLGLRRVVLARIDRIAAVAREAQDGDTAARCTLPECDEVALVGAAFDRMLDRLAERHGDLERRVAGRTAELQNALAAARAATAAKTEFLAVMSHELRTPMNAVLGATDLLASTRLDKQQRDFVQTASSSGQLLLSLLNDVLDFSKIEAGKVELECLVFDIDLELEAVLRTVSDAAEAKGLLVLGQVAADVPSLLLGDPVRLRQILLNLVANGLKFTASGSVIVSVHLVDDALLFMVQDTGVGIGPDGRDRLFAAFQQADSSTTRKFGGTGLGLAICKRLVERMGGEIGVESEPGLGSVFWFRLPRQTPSPEQVQEHQDDTGLRGNTALLQLRDAELAQCVERHVRSFGMQVLHQDEADAGGRPEVILADSAARLPGHVPLLLVGGCRTRQLPGRRMRRLAVDHRKSELREVLRELLDAGEPKDEPAADSLGFRVLVAEDNAVNRKVVAAMLTKIGCEVDLAEDGVRAVEMCREGPFDLVLMDYQMPNMDGLEATLRIRAEEARNADAHQPIVALTANAGVEFERKCLAAGMDGFLAKPVRIGELRGMVARLQQARDQHGEGARSA